MDIMNIRRLGTGARVIVRDGQKRPPRNHSRKLKNWKETNFVGKIEFITEDCVKVKNLDQSSSCRVVTKWYDTNSKAELKGIPLR